MIISPSSPPLSRARFPLFSCHLSLYNRSCLDLLNVLLPSVSCHVALLSSTESINATRRPIGISSSHGVHERNAHESRLYATIKHVQRSWRRTRCPIPTHTSAVCLFSSEYAWRCRATSNDDASESGWVRSNGNILSSAGLRDLEGDKQCNVFYWIT